MTDATLRAVGGSIMVAIPKSMLDGLGLGANEKVSLHLDGNRLVIEPRLKPKYKLAELLEQCDLDAPAHPDVKLWDELKPDGQEII
jgi:antitoxin ChpS